MSALHLTLIRFASIALTAAILAAFADGSWFLPLVFSLGMAHYALSLRYSASRVVALGHRPTALAGAALLTGAAVVLYAVPVPLVLCFGVHYAFNEGYAGRKLRLGAHGSREGLFPHAAALHGAAYAAVLRHDLGALVSPAVLLGIFAAAYMSFATRLLRGVDASPRELGRDFTFELLSPLAVVVSMFWRIRFFDVLLYHYAFWTLFPMLTRRRPTRWYLEYVGSAVVATLLGLAVLPLGVFGAGGTALYMNQFIFWSYLHITASFALSDLHPTWILRRFAVVPAAAT